MKKIVYVATAVVMTLYTLCSCEKDEHWGVKMVYMPQAAIANNINNEYFVPMLGQHDANYRVQDGNLEVYLGVYRSGEGDLQSYSVDVYYDENVTDEAVLRSPDRVKLPYDSFSYPASLLVEDGHRQNTFILSVNLEKIKKEYPDFKSKMWVVTIGVNNPSRYELNEKISKTTVIIDGSKFI